MAAGNKSFASAPQQRLRSTALPAAEDAGGQAGKSASAVLLLVARLLAGDDPDKDNVPVSVLSEATEVVIRSSRTGEAEESASKSSSGSLRVIGERPQMKGSVQPPRPSSGDFGAVCSMETGATPAGRLADNKSIVRRRGGELRTLPAGLGALRVLSTGRFGCGAKGYPTMSEAPKTLRNEGPADSDLAAVGAAAFRSSRGGDSVATLSEGLAGSAGGAWTPTTKSPAPALATPLPQLSRPA
mmetsp:Transcript_65209/g.187749  ORF Transcript_65209/g.187749 Transcript_65209/m.187749 type:complete len:242 (-) Transcript_65209:1246-1971(-)